METKAFHERYKRIHDKVPYYFYLDSNKLAEDFQWINDNKIDSIRLTPDLYKIKSIEPILKLTQLKLLVIFLKDIDLSKLCHFKQLENLGMGEPNFNIDVSGLHHLKELYLLYHKNIKGLETLKNLEKLILVKGDTDFFKEELFKCWHKLNELALLSSKLPTTLSFLKHQKELRELEIHNSRSKYTVEALTDIHLQILKIGNCKSVEGLEKTLPQLNNLRWLAITDSVTLKSSKFVDKLEKLEAIVVLGSSYFEDGDISNLKRLKHVGIDNKKHYNLKDKDFASNN